MSAGKGVWRTFQEQVTPGYLPSSEASISLELACTGTAVILAAVAQAATGYGFALILAPALQLISQSVNGLKMVVVLSMIVNLVLLLPARKGADGRRAVTLALPAMLLTPAGAWLALRLDRSVVGLVMGFMVAASAVALLMGLRMRLLRGGTGAILAGGTSGMMNALCGIGGPTVALYVANADWPRNQVIPTTQLYFLVINGVTVSLLGLPTVSWVATLFLLAMLCCGLVVGIWVRRLLSDEVFRTIIIGLALLGGTMSAMQSLIHLFRG
jgi:uncharacterized membrane protein YfcA